MKDLVDSLEGGLRSKFLELVKRSASEEKFIEFINSSLSNTKLDSKSLEIILDLTLAVVDQFGYVHFNYLDSTQAYQEDCLEDPPITEEQKLQVSDLSSYDGDDEESDDTFIFPCHVVYDDCHPELLSDYHREHLKPSRNPVQIIKLPKVCEFVIESMFNDLKDYITLGRHRQTSIKQGVSNDSSVQLDEKLTTTPVDTIEADDDGDSEPSSSSSSSNSVIKSTGLSNHLNFIVRLIKKINRICLNEKRNCRILSKTGTLSIILENINYLIEMLPDEQHIYLEPLIKFAFTLSDYRISGPNLKQLFKLIKNEETSLNIVLRNLQNLLNHHFRILRNIQPSKSINFPTASRTPEEIEYDRYLANSWHWRLRSKVIENKRRRSRSESQPPQDLKAQQQAHQTKLVEDEERVNDEVKKRLFEMSSKSTSQTTSSWLECSLMTPLSNITPLIYNGEVKFCCSLWLSVCGDLLVVESNKSAAKRKRASKLDDNSDAGFDIDWPSMNGHWLRLTSRRRLVRRHKNKIITSLKPRQRRLSAKIRTRQAYDKEDEEREEKEEKARKSDAEVSQGHSRSGRGFKLFHSSLRRHPGKSINNNLDKHQDNLVRKNKKHLIAGLEQTKQQINDELAPRVRDHSQDQLIHLISFAMDSLTIEVWLNVKCMTFYVRTCRVTRDGQTDVHDNITFQSHLEANGAWSNVIFCLEEETEHKEMKAVNMKVIVNAIHEENVKLVFSTHRSPLTNFALLIGCERSTFGYVWKLSQINLYKNIPDKSMPIYLLGKGPDFWSFTNFRQQSLFPLPDITQRHIKILLDPKVLLRYSMIDEDQALNWLTQNIVISYVAHQPEHFLDYSPSMTTASLMNPIPADYEFSNSAERFIQAKTLDFSRSIKFNQNNGFGSALVEAGGVESVLMSFAEVVRRSHQSSHQTHALAFSVLLKMVQTNLYHLNKFLDELNGLKLIEYILAHPKCQVSCEMLESYFDFCLVFHEDSTRALIKSPKLIYHLLTSWRVWHKDAKVAKLLYRRLIKLLHTSAPRIQRGKNDHDHYYIDHNFRTMTQAGAIDILMDILRKCLVTPDEDCPYIDHELIGHIVQLISLLFKQPPGLDVMLDITEFLLFLHPDPKAYVEVNHDRIAFLHKIESVNGGERIIFDDDDENQTPSGVRTPFSTTPSETSETSDDELEPTSGRNFRANQIGRQKRFSELRANGSNGSTSSSNGAVSADSSTANRISNQCSRNLAEILQDFNRRHAKGGNLQSGQTNWFKDSTSVTLKRQDRYGTNSNRSFSVPNSDQTIKCSNRNYAIARVADMLHFSIIEPTSASNTLTEAIEKAIIDPRKFIILANNELSLVREKVLRLFLYCMRACYQANLKSVLMKYDQGTESSSYRICTPIHLMARQLLRYSTTSRMIQLCHGILMGVSDLDAADTFFASFDIDTSCDQFQLNILVLLIQMITKLSKPKEMVGGLRIVTAYMQQLVRIDEISTVSVIIKNDLIDCLMSLYFSYVKHAIIVGRQSSSEEEDEEEEDDANKEDDAEEDKDEQQLSGDYETLVLELDRLLIFIVRFYLQNQTAGELVKSIDEILLYLELLNTQVPVHYKFLLRDRMVKIFLTKLRFCNHYELSAKQRAYNGKFQHLLKSLLKNSESNKFSNVLPEFEPSDLSLNEVFWPPTPPPQPSDMMGEREQETNSSLGCVDSSGNGTSIETAAGDFDHQRDRQDQSATIVPSYSNGTSDSIANKEQYEEGVDIQRAISESSVLDRFKATFAMICSFVTTRELDVIPSPLERDFIMKCLKILARHLIECDHQRTFRRKSKQPTSQWTLIVSKLERSFRTYFSRLILYLLSPTSDGMNLDERKYFAHQILNMFQVDQLLNMLGESSSSSSHKVLLVFIKDLMDYEPASQDDALYTELGNIGQSEEELPDDTEVKLRDLICGLETEVSGGDLGGHNRGGQRLEALRLTNKRWWSASAYNSQEENGDQKYRAIWMEDMARAREDLRDRLETFKSKLRVSGSNSSLGNSNKPTLVGGSLENLTLNTSDEQDRFLDEAVSITRDVVNDKHEQRKAYLEDVKQNKIYNYHVRQQWLSLIIGHSHERAIWYMADYYPKSWELNPVEGPSRSRRRLRPCKLKLESRFLRQSTEANSANGSSTRGQGTKLNRLQNDHKLADATTNSQLSEEEDDDSDSADDWYSLYSPHPLCSLIINNEQTLDSNELRIRMFTTDKIHFNCDCSIIRPNEVCHGEVSIASWCIHFIGNRSEIDENCDTPFTSRRSNLMSKHSLNRQRPQQSRATRNGLRGVPSGSSLAHNRRQYEGRSSGVKGPVNMNRSLMNTTTTVVEDLWFDEIVEIWDRRYQLQEVGLEIFLTNNMTYLLSFRNNSDREDFKQNLMREQHKMINLQRFNLTTSLSRLTQMWRDGKLTNFDYLTCLNKLAGRSFNDLMQYPVFPFILSNYTSEVLNLNESDNFRNLKRPMAIQNEAREANFKNVYQMSLSSGPTISSFGLSKPYHYGNHYSNSATVLHFLVRLPPFTQMLIEYQDNNFDQPDRTFHAIANTWQLITRDSNTDFKELIPEFFFLPEMFTNIGNLELGRKQNNELVDDVRLPPWCPNMDARLFTLIHRQALESAFVSENLHHWIDLIFGYKQTGKPAIEALNVFHPATYYGGIDFNKDHGGNGGLSSSSGVATDSLSAINLTIATRSAKSSAFGSVGSNADLQNAANNSGSSSAGWNIPAGDPGTLADGHPPPSPRRLALNKFLQADIERSALETMIKTYGQMPRQLFSSPMKQRSANLFVQQFNQNELEKLTTKENGNKSTMTGGRKFEPLKQVKGLRWGNYVGSPSDNDIIAVKHKRIILEPVKSDYRVKKDKNKTNKKDHFGPKLLSKQSDKFHFCSLANGDVAILRNNTSLMLDYRADRKSSGTYQLSIPSARYSRRAGLSRVSRMNLFSNMIISRQQFSFLEPIHSPSNQFNSDAAAASTSQSSSIVATLTGGNSGSRVKFSLDSLNLVSWFYIDGVVRVKHPAPSNQKPSIPLVQANTIVDTMTTCCSVPELNLLLVGYRSGSICAHIVSTAYETVPLQKQTETMTVSNLSAGPSAVHFLNTTSSGSSTMDASLLGPGRVSDNDGEPYTAVSLAGKTLQSVRSMNKTTRWLYCHDKRINCIKINVSFGIVVTGSDDGTSVIWDLNSLTFVRTIDYKLSSLRIRKEEGDMTKSCSPDQTKRWSTPTVYNNPNNYVSWTYGRSHKQKLQDYLCTCNEVQTEINEDLVDGESHEQQTHQNQPQRCFICGSGVNLIAISDTLGDIVTIKQLNNRLAAANEPVTTSGQVNYRGQDHISSVRSQSGTPASSTVSLSSQATTTASTNGGESSLTSVIYVHTINGALVNFVNCHAHVTAVTYSNAPEGISINVIVVGMIDGLVRLYSSWDLSRVKEFRVSGLESPISDIMYTRDSQLMYVAYGDGQMVVLRNKKKGLVSLPKEWIL